MHMADALLSPAVGGTMWVVTAGAIAYCSKKVRAEPDDLRIPLMGVLGAFIFAAQMISFTIPVTGSSGHLGGGLILSILLGPHAAFLTIASVLVVQAFFFADGGLLALGCNIFNLGVFPAFIAYPFIYKNIVGSAPTPGRISVASMAAAIIGLRDRGLIAPGYHANINVIEFDKLTLHAPEIVDDLPGGGRRLDQRASGYRYMLVAGEVITKDDQPTGVLPGKLVRGKQSAPAGLATT